MNKTIGESPYVNRNWVILLHAQIISPKTYTKTQMYGYDTNPGGPERGDKYIIRIFSFAKYIDYKCRTLEQLEECWLFLQKEIFKNRIKPDRKTEDLKPSINPIKKR